MVEVASFYTLKCKKSNLIFLAHITEHLHNLMVIVYHLKMLPNQMCYVSCFYNHISVVVEIES